MTNLIRENKVYYYTFISVIILSLSGGVYYFWPFLNSQILLNYLFSPKVKSETAKILEEILFSDTKLHILKPQNVSSTLTAPGTTSYVEKASILSLATARVVTLRKDVGDRVLKGEILAKLNKKRLQLEYIKAENGVRSARANYDLTKARFYEAEKRVQKQIIELEKEKASIVALKAEYENSRISKRNKDELLKIGGISKSEINDFMAQFIATKSRYYNALKEQEKNSIGFRSKDILAAGYIKFKTRKEWEKIVIELNTKLESNELKVSKAALENAESQLKINKLLLEEATILSPISGVVAARHIEIGEMVKPDNPVYTVVSTRNVYIVSSINENQLYRIRKGLLTQFTVDAFPGKSFRGRIKLISPVLDPKTRMAEIKILAPNPNRRLKPGMFVRTKIITSSKRNTLIIPEGSFRLEKNVSSSEEKNIQINVPKKAYAYIVNEGNAYRKEIVVGHRYDEGYQVLKGLKKNDIIASTNVESLKDGSRLFLKEDWGKKKRELYGKEKSKSKR